MNKDLDQAINFHKKGNYYEAEKLYLKILKGYKKINKSEVQQLLGTLYLQQRKLDEARLYLERSYNINPVNPFTINNLGLLETYCKKKNQALKYFDLNINENNFYDSFINKLNLYFVIRDFNTCIKLCKIYLKKFIDNQKIKNIFALSLHRIGDSENAERMFTELLNSNHKIPDTFFNYSILLYDKKNYTNALEMINSFISSQNIKDDALYHRHKIFKARKEFKAAETDLFAALKINYKFKYKKALILLHEDLKNHELIEEMCEKFISEETNKDNQCYLRSKKMIAHLYSANFSALADFKTSIDKEILNSPDSTRPLSLVSVCDDPNLIKEFNKKFWSKLIKEKNFNDKISLDKNITKSKKNIKKIRIGFFSGDFRNHAVTHLIKDLFLNFNKSKFEIFAYSYYFEEDIYRQEIKSNFNYFYDLDKLSDNEMLNLIFSHQLDIAVDLSGHTLYGQTWLFNYSIAKKKINYLGFPGTIGSENYDYIIADKFIIPNEYSQFYSEKVIYMPETYQPFSIINFDKPKVSRRDFHLPEDCFLAVTFARVEKILPNVFDIWMKVLNEVNHVKLAMHITNKYAVENIRKYCHLKNFKFNNIIFLNSASHKNHLARLSLFDLYLDTFPYNSHTLMSDALFHAGIPAVSITGKSFASRVSLSLLNYANLKECAVGSEEEYSLKIKKIINDKDYYNNLKNRLNDKRKLVSNRMIKFTKDFENIMIQILNI